VAFTFDFISNILMFSTFLMETLEETHEVLRIIKVGTDSFCSTVPELM